MKKKALKNRIVELDRECDLLAAKLSCADHRIVAMQNRDANLRYCVVTFMRLRDAAIARAMRGEG